MNADRVTTISTAAASGDRAAYQGRLWVTRPRPGVDRMASAWLIRRLHRSVSARFGVCRRSRRRCLNRACRSTCSVSSSAIRATAARSKRCARCSASREPALSTHRGHRPRPRSQGRPVWRARMRTVGAMIEGLQLALSRRRRPARTGHDAFRFAVSLVRTIGRADRTRPLAPAEAARRSDRTGAATGKNR